MGGARVRRRSERWAAGVDPISWTPDPLGRRYPPWRHRDRPPFPRSLPRQAVSRGAGPTCRPWSDSRPWPSCSTCSAAESHAFAGTGWAMAGHLRTELVLDTLGHGRRATPPRTPSSTTGTKGAGPPSPGRAAYQRHPPAQHQAVRGGARCGSPGARLRGPSRTPGRAGSAPPAGSRAYRPRDSPRPP